ncbi:ParM/StbA family protein [Turicibacter sp.]|uniref:ParM/StbA family protein n=1 Tax=Turicibacter sp. TaxID=2049042 RepID=UPI001B557EA6|nr:ParM/StbA family protein [Turicibacter sp.]MBP3904619.1 ParM/StbA family protein [Turicibacter sp.]MBP3907339.1 ParM/StbA family protein [Turicibacter sp.]
MNYKVGGDSGKSSTKVSLRVEDGNNIRKQIATTCEKTDTKAKSDSNHEVFFNGTRYLVGEPNNKLNLRLRTERSKEDEVHKICLLTALCLAIREAEGKVDENKVTIHNVSMTLNMPFSEYIDKTKRESMVRFYQSQKMVEIVVDGIKYNLMLQVLPYYEGLGAMLLKADDVKSKRVTSLDFGSMNVGYATFDNLKILTGDENTGSLELGCHSLLTKIKKLFNDNGVKNINADSEIIRVLNGENSFVQRDLIIKANELIRNHVETIYTELFNLDVDVDNTEIIASGGAVNLYQPFIKEFFTNDNVKILKENTVFANAEGSLKLIK